MGAVGHASASSDFGRSQPAPQPAVADDLEGRPWLLVGYAGPGGRLLPVLPGTEITATFANRQVSGGAGCNDYNAGYLLVGNVLRVSPIAGTLAQCWDPPGIMQQEAAYFRNLQQATRVDVVGDTLTLRTTGGATLLEYMPQPQTPLEGTTWTALNYNNGQGAVVSIITGTTITASFGHALNGEAITIQQVASTRMFCANPPGVMDQETAYLTALTTATRYRIEGALLILERDNGARVATYTATNPASTS